MNNQNIYSQQKYQFKEDWTVAINTMKLKEIGIYNHLDILPIYIFIVSQADHKLGKMGEVLFSKTFICDIFHIGHTKYKEILNKMIELGYVSLKEIGTKNNSGTLVKINHYTQVTSFPKSKKN